MEKNKFYITTYWQSLDLLQARLDRNTADFVYVRYDGVPHPRPRTDKDEFDASIIPAWSLGRLWELMYKFGLVFEYATDCDPDSVILSLIEAISYYSKTHSKDD